MNFRGLLTRWRQSQAGRAAARAKYEVIIYFDGPRTKWDRSARNWQYEEHHGGVRVALLMSDGLMPEPHGDDILQRKLFRFDWLARAWIFARLKDFDHSKIVGEVRPL